MLININILSLSFTNKHLSMYGWYFPEGNYYLFGIISLNVSHFSILYNITECQKKAKLFQSFWRIHQSNIPVFLMTYDFSPLQKSLNNVYIPLHFSSRSSFPQFHQYWDMCISREKLDEIQFKTISIGESNENDEKICTEFLCF